MSLILLVSTGIRLTALGWSLVLLRRIQDWRMGCFTVILALMGLRQLLTLRVRGDGSLVIVSPQALAELLGLLVSLMLFLGVFVLQRVLSERQQSEAALQASEAAWRSSEARYRTLVDCSFQGMCIHQDAIVQFANEAMAQTFGYASADALRGQDYRQFIPAHEHPRLERYRQALLGGAASPSSFACQGVKQDGTLLWLECVASRVEWQMRPAVMVIFLDITERKQAEQAWRDSEERYRVLVEGSVQGIAIVSRAGRRLFANQALLTMLGYASLEAYLEHDALGNAAAHERDRLRRYWEALLSGTSCPTRYEYEACRIDGTPIWLECVVTPITWRGELALMSTVQEVTERKHAEEERLCLENQLRQAKKMEALGTLAGGMAHDFNHEDDQAEMSRGAGRILFVDDEPALTSAMSYLLEMLGYQVTASTSSREALDIFSAHASDFDMVITDQTMPYITGEGLIREVRRIRPDIPIILCTGFSRTMDAEKAQALGIDAFCVKPLEVRDLAVTLQQVLAKRIGSVERSRPPATE